MREICPSCGKDMIATTEAFEINGDAVRGIPHLLCRSCGVHFVNIRYADECLGGDSV